MEKCDMLSKAKCEVFSYTQMMLSGEGRQQPHPYTERTPPDSASVPRRGDPDLTRERHR